MITHRILKDRYALWIANKNPIIIKSRLKGFVVLIASYNHFSAVNTVINKDTITS